MKALMPHSAVLFSPVLGIGIAVARENNFFNYADTKQDAYTAGDVSATFSPQGKASDLQRYARMWTFKLGRRA